ncbi:hypothetical protein J4444_04830 [Candidatus Woesearchaeota archaeon]|nr:hypothetical protein [Candidatus Woesearchaeota archaeon]
MSVFDKLKFWKKEDLDFDRMADKEMTGMPMDDNLGFEQDNLGLEEKSPFPEEPNMGQSAFPLREKAPSFQQQSTYREVQPTQSSQAQSTPSASKELELINSKLDTLKAMLSSMDQRMEHIERSSGEKKERLW